MAQKKAINPFYVLLVMAGLLFFITACAYGVMTLIAVNPGANVSRGHPLLVLMRRHGDMLLLIELAALAACTMGAIGTDEYWTRRQSRKAMAAEGKEETEGELG
ncbi:MAG: hypothetical protein KDA42_14460 [Planctomycetales bacterium]|nr:hypothetical protein [Planctomycetales bacterium]